MFKSLLHEPSAFYLSLLSCTWCSYHKLLAQVFTSLCNFPGKSREDGVFHPGFRSIFQLQSTPHQSEIFGGCCRMPMIEATILTYHLKLEFHSEFLYKVQFEDLFLDINVHRNYRRPYLRLIVYISLMIFDSWAVCNVGFCWMESAAIDWWWNLVMSNRGMDQSSIPSSPISALHCWVGLFFLDRNWIGLQGKSDYCGHPRRPRAHTQVSKIKI